MIKPSQRGGLLRKNFTKEFKAKVAVKAIQADETMAELSSKYEVHPTQIATWKKDFINNASAAFETKKATVEQEKDNEKLFTKIGQMQVEIDFLKHVLGK